MCNWETQYVKTSYRYHLAAGVAELEAESRRHETLACLGVTCKEQFII